MPDLIIHTIHKTENHARIVKKKRVNFEFKSTFKYIYKTRKTTDSVPYEY